MSLSIRKREIIAKLEAARQTTLDLLAAVPDDHLNIRVHDFYSPIGWHFGHIGMTEEYWVCSQALKQSPRNPEYSFLFANIPENPKDNRVHLPSREEIIGYLLATHTTVVKALKTADLETNLPLLADGYAWEFALQHECQHQETIAELRQLLSQQFNAPDILPATANLVRDTPPPVEMVAIPGGTFWMGSDNRHDYDNEKSVHEVMVADFEMDKLPVTAGHWAQFIAEGGYERQELWTADGWNWRQAYSITHPEYWFPVGKGYGCFYAGGVRGLHPHEPVTGISWHEANAYARWMGKRLPSESEWEYAAAFEPAAGQMRRYPWPTLRGSFRADYGNKFGFPSAADEDRTANAFGLCCMAGGAWEWTSTPFLPYPGFTAFPYDGYSKDHMDSSHYVCRGGSWASAEPVLRCSFRNWYIPTYRQGFLGLRCAK